jgi:uncharacterized protein YicC (UPF0701 family)
MDNAHEPATKHEVAELKAELKQDIAESKAELKQDIAGLKLEIGELKADLKLDIAMVRSEMQHTHDALIERIADSETKLLKAFFAFAESNQARRTETERESAALKDRIGILERRVTDVERKVNFPGYPAQ